jgi:hypothetical protein
VRDEPTDQDLIVDHPFQPAAADNELWDRDLCVHIAGGSFPCGYVRSEHADQGKEPPNE